MNVRRYGRLIGVAVVGALALSACGTDENTDSSSAGSASSASTSTIACAGGTLTGAGSSAQANAVDEWTKRYIKACKDATVNYQATGSGAGITSFTQNQVVFAGSDSALKPEQQPKADARCKAGGAADGKAINIPMVVGPVAVAYKLDGVQELNLRPVTIAKIFAGKITKWDDPAIKADNADAKLPSTPIQAFHRSDESGTSENFTKFVKATAAADWPYEPAKAWPAAIKSGQGANKSSGVADAVKGGTGTIGYMEQSYAENSGLPMAKVANGSGEFVELTGESAAKAVEAAEVKGTGNDLALKIDYATKAAGAYPIVLVTYEIVCEKGTPAAQLDLLKSFLTYTSSEDGQAALADLGYAPLPATLLTKVQASVKALS